MKELSRLSIIAVLILVFYFALISLWYAFSPFYLASLERHFANVSFLFLKGYPLYHSFDYPLRYSMLYGPAGYIVNAFIMLVFGVGVVQSKIGGSIAALLSLFFLYLVLGKSLGRQIALYCIGYVTLVYLWMRNWAIWNKIDSYILLLISVGLFFVSRLNGWVIKSIFLGLSLGVAANMRITSSLYFIPLLILLFLKNGLKGLMLSLLIAFIIFVTPFVIFDNISFSLYKDYLLLALSHGLSSKVFMAMISFTIIRLLIPALAGLYYFNIHYANYRRSLEFKWYLFGLIIALIAAIIFGSKDGAGAYHLLPFTLLIPYLFVLTREKELFVPEKEASQGAMILAIVFMLLLPGTVLQHGETLNYMTVMHNKSRGVVSDIKTVLKKYDGKSIQMGYGEDRNEAMTLYSPYVVFDQDIYFLDAVAMMDMKLSEINIPQSSVDYLDQCKFDVFLVPKHDKPFAEHTHYDWSRNLFDDNFREKFFEKYELAERTRYYDIWKCKENI